MLERIRKRTVKFQENKFALLGVIILLTIVAAGISFSSRSASAIGQNIPNQSIQNWIGHLADPIGSTSRHEAMQRLEAAGAPAVDALIKTLQSPDPQTRRESADMLGYIASPAAMDSLVGLLDQDEDSTVRAAAAASLSELNQVAVAGVLERAAAEDSSLRVRQAATEALVALRSNLADMAHQDERNARTFAVVPGQPHIVYLAMRDGILASHDSGKTWTKAGNPPSPVMSLAVSPADPDILYAGTESTGLYESVNGGATWIEVSRALGEQSGLPVAASAVAIDPGNAHRIFAAKGTFIGTSNAQVFPLGVMLSDDSGASWRAVEMPEITNPVTRLFVDNHTLYAVSGDQVLHIDF